MQPCRSKSPITCITTSIASFDCWLFWCARLTTTKTLQQNNRIFCHHNENANAQLTKSSVINSILPLSLYVPKGVVPHSHSKTQQETHKVKILVGWTLREKHFLHDFTLRLSYGVLLLMHSFLSAYQVYHQAHKKKLSTSNI